MPSSLIAVVDDDEAVRLSTCNLLKRAGFAVSLFKSGEEFLAAWGGEPIACILLDLQMPGIDGLGVLRTLQGRPESPPILVVTAHGDIGVAVDAMKLGAHHFMEKPYAAEDLLGAIAKALASSLRSEDARTMRGDARALVEALSQRQRQVLQGILRGLQNKIIAFELGLSIRTIEAYRAQLLEKLGVRGTAEAVRLAIAAGLPEMEAR